MGNDLALSHRNANGVVDRSTRSFRDREISPGCQGGGESCSHSQGNARRARVVGARARTAALECLIYAISKRSSR